MFADVLPFLAASPLSAWDVLWDILVMLAMALLLGTLAERLGQSVLVGYLIAGTLVGPNVLGWISTQRELFSIAELGVSLLLFTIGLEFSPKRLLSLGSIVLKIGPLQVLMTSVFAFSGAIFCGLGGREAIVVGMMVTVSSTACVLRLLTDRAEIDSEHGRTALGILLIQDAAVIPMMLLVSVMATGGTAGSIFSKLTVALILTVVLGGVFYLFFNFVVPRLLLLPTWRKNRDLPILLAVIMATGSAWATHAAGLSPALGSFAAGVLLAISPFATQIRADTRPLTTLMVTLFFAAIGMFGDPVWLVHHWPAVAGVVLAIVVGKLLLITLLARAFGRPWRFAVASALSLAQVGEFSFVLAMIAQRNIDETVLISSTTFRVMVAATIATLLFTPYFVAASPRVGALVERALLSAKDRSHDSGAIRESEAMEEARKQGSSDLILVVGFGPAGQRVAKSLMDSCSHRTVVIDLDPEAIQRASQIGVVAFLGDATHRDILEHAGIHEARAVVVTMPDHAIVRSVIHLVRDIAPEAFIVARCRYHALHWELLKAGAHEVVDEEDLLGRGLVEEVLKLARPTRDTDSSSNDPAP